MKRHTCLISTISLSIGFAVQPLPAASQTVHGVVTDQMGQNVSGALALLFDTSGTQLTYSTVDSRGRFILQTENQGEYYVRVLRIGFQPWNSAHFQLTEVPYNLPVLVNQIRVTLPPITIESRDRCESRPTHGIATAALWEAINVALLNTRSTMELRLYRFRTTMTQRNNDAFGVFVDEETDTRGGFSSWPFQSLDPVLLAEDGFVQRAQGGPIYYGPDTDVLFSDSFLEQHCWGLATEDSGNLIGLTFQPTTDRHVPDIEGALWLDRESLELQHLDFEYTGLDSWVPNGSAGGHYEFRKLPNGSWFLSDWELRAPIEKFFRGTRRTSFGGSSIRSGEVTEVRLANGDVVYRSARPDQEKSPGGDGG
jgi:hypothetical protein